MRPLIWLSGLLTAFVCIAAPALAQKQGGILKIYHRDNPPSASIHEEATFSTLIPFMPVFNNLVIFDQHEPQNSQKTIKPELAKSWQWSADGRQLKMKL